MMESFWRKLRQRLELDHTADPNTSPPPNRLMRPTGGTRPSCWTLERCTFLLARCAGSPPAKLKAPKSLRARAHKHSLCTLGRATERTPRPRQVPQDLAQCSSTRPLRPYPCPSAWSHRIRRALGQNSDCRPNTRDRTDCWVLCDALALRVPCRHPSISTSIEATHQLFTTALPIKPPTRCFGASSSGIRLS